MFTDNLKTVTAAPGANRRTKNRLRENGPEFSIWFERQVCSFDKTGRLWTLLRSPNGWQGWVLSDDIVIGD